jgi:hypothetical protein
VSTTIAVLLQQDYLILLLSVMAEQCGLPLPATSILIAAGALAGLPGHHAAHALIVAVTASLMSDSLWFWFGRRGETSFLKALSKMPLEPGTYLSRARSVYSRHGVGRRLHQSWLDCSWPDRNSHPFPRTHRRLDGNPGCDAALVLPAQEISKPAANRWWAWRESATSRIFGAPGPFQNFIVCVVTVPIGLLRVA